MQLISSTELYWDFDSYGIPYNIFTIQMNDQLFRHSNDSSGFSNLIRKDINCHEILPRLRLHIDIVAVTWRILSHLQSD